MKKTFFILAIGLVLSGLGLAILSGNTPSVPANDAQKINLALRQTAHRLLQQAGDSTSRIAPITQTSEHTFVVKIERAFNYDSLPVFIQRSFAQYDISTPYKVAVWDCNYSKIVLGYASFDVTENQNVPCAGRSQTGDCLNFTVSFEEKKEVSPQNNGLLWLLGGLGLLAIGAGLYFFFKRKPIQMPTEIATASANTHIVMIGKMAFDKQLHTLKCDETEQKLSEKEAALLDLFSQNPNELLDRDFILKEIWQDEGVLVTRTVDVYVSRLRKLLKPDETLKIVNVHGRGYRFEVV